ncbi:MAG: ribonuclease H family protein, partial [Dehalococcoidia bacterium]
EGRRLCAGRFIEHVFDPNRYNALYSQYRDEGQNLNHLLADGHVAVLEPLLSTSHPGDEAPTVVADQFADERLVRARLKDALMQRGLSMPRLIQAHRAEANVAVAAASILARDRFLEWLEAASESYGIRLPKGGSNPAIIAAARRLRRERGDDALGRVAKLHFATTRQVLRG